jgi:hypothetical protein
VKNVDQTIISQYATSPAMRALIASIDDWIDPSADLDNFYVLIWNIDTAVGAGLDIWGRIVGIGRVLTVATGVYLGETGSGGASGDSFNVGIFYSGQPTTTNYTLTDEAYRRTILAKAAANITNGSVQAINHILMNILFSGRGNCYVIDNEDMTMVYHFDFHLLPYEDTIVRISGVLPTPVGVSASVVYP